MFAIKKPKKHTNKMCKYNVEGLNDTAMVHVITNAVQIFNRCHATNKVIVLDVCYLCFQNTVQQLKKFLPIKGTSMCGFTLPLLHGLFPLTR